VFSCLVVCRWQVRHGCAAMRTMAGVGDLVQRIENDRTGQILSDREVERLGDAVCGLHLARGD
jgi:hypothetical protein